MSKKVALVRGGISSEKEISLLSAQSLEQALKDLGWEYEIIDAGIDLPKKLMESRPDVALLALHGKYAEDGTVQGICEYLKIPYTGSGVLTSALCFNKIYSKQIFIQNGIPTPAYQVFDLKNQKIEDLQLTIDPPLVVKPSRDGSSVGISLCESKEEVIAALKEASQYDQQILIEKMIKGIEVTVPMLLGKPLTPIEIHPKQGFYDYKNKYTQGKTEYILPARLPEPAMELCQNLSAKIYQIMGIRGYCRIDFMFSSDFKPFALEVNTLPGFTKTSLFPQSAKYDGIEFVQLVKTLLNAAERDYEGVH